MRKAFAVVAAGLAGLGALSACSTKSTASSTGSSSGRSSAQGVDSSTIRVGVTYVDFSAIRNIVDIDQGDFRTSYTALFNDINAHGGINGRKIVPFFAPVNPIGTAPAAEACTQLTEDDKVFVVLGFFNASDPLCYLDTHGVNIVGGPATGASLSPAQQQEEKATWFSTALSEDHLIPKELDVFNQEHLFSGQKVAVVALAQDQSVLQNLVVPELQKLGVDVVQTAINDVPATDITAANQQMALIGQKFQSAGAEVVVAAGEGASEGWPESLKANHSTYHPRLVATNYDSLSAWIGSKTGYDPAVLPGAVSALASEPWDQFWSDAGLQHCVSLINAAGPKEAIVTPTPANINKEPQTWVSAGQACANVTLLAAVLKAAGPNLDNHAFLTGGESLTNLTVPGSGVPGALNFGPQYHDGNGPLVVYTWDPNQKAFTDHTAG
jgi:hypothetical protein